VNKYGFVETPYQGQGRRVTSEVHIPFGDGRGAATRRAGNQPIDAKGASPKTIVCRHAGDVRWSRPTRSTTWSVAKQLVSVAGALIRPENDDANRALMGSNMQRQAMPWFAPKRRRRTAWKAVARDSGASIAGAAPAWSISGRHPYRRRATEVSIRDQIGRRHLPADEVPALQPEHCINQRPLVKVAIGEEGDIIADGSLDRSRRARARAQRAGRVMPWNGYNFEEKKSIDPFRAHVKGPTVHVDHIEEFEVCPRHQARSGEITRDIRMSRKALKNLDEAGIVYIGAEVRAGTFCAQDTPKGESPMTPEEKLLRAISARRPPTCANLVARAAGCAGPSSKCACSTATARQGRACARDRA